MKIKFGVISLNVEAQPTLSLREKAIMEPLAYSGKRFSPALSRQCGEARATEGSEAVARS